MLVRVDSHGSLARQADHVLRLRSRLNQTPIRILNALTDIDPAESGDSTRRAIPG